jgi:hypothetical protein
MRECQVANFHGQAFDAYYILDIKFSAHERFWNNLHQVAQNRKIG